MKLSLLRSLWVDFRANIRGTSAVEFAIIGPLFLLFLFGVIEIGRMLWIQNSLQYAVEQAARCAVVNKTTCGNLSQIQNYAVGMMYGQTISNSVFSSTSTTCGTQVTATLPFSTVVLPISVTLTAASCRPTS